MTDKELEKIYNEAYRAVYWTAMSLLKNEADAEDIVQDTFMTLIESYDTLEDKNKVLPWLKKIAANKCLNRLTRTKTDTVEDEFFEDVEATPEDFLPDSIVESEDARNIIMGIIDKSLSEDIRRTLILFYFDELSTKEIAETLGVPDGTVRRRLNFARNKIKKEVEEYEEESNSKLFGAAMAMPFLSKLFIKEAELVPLKPMPASLTSALSASVKASTKEAGSKIAAEVAKKGTSIMTKRIIGICAAVVAVGAITGGIIYFLNNKTDVKPEETVTHTEESESEGVVESDATVTTTEATTTESTEPAIEISASEYLANYPVPGNGIMVYFKLAPEIDFYPDAMDSSNTFTVGEYYNNSINSEYGLAEVVCMVENGSKAHVVFTCNPINSIDYYRQNAETGIFGDGSSTISVGDPEICDNGFKIYTVEMNFEYGTSTFYVLEYQIDSENTFQIYTLGFNEAFDEPIYQEELASILDYYRNLEDPILVVDKNATVNIVP